MTGDNHFLKLVVMVGLALAGMILTAVASGIILLISGMEVRDLLVMSEKGMEGMSAGLIRSLLAVQHLMMFIVPSVLFGLLFIGKKLLHGFDLAITPGIKSAVLGILFLMAAYPLVNLSFMLNEAMPLPSWAGDFENQAEETLKAILKMDTPLIFILTLMLIAILPGIGEELLFRGIVQKHVAGWLKNPIAGIWISAFIFSAIHMQFEGFLPRVVLGAILGYLYHWTKNLWVPIIAHAFNNGIQVVLIYSMDMDLDSFAEEGSDQLQWWMIPLSVVAMYFIFTAVQKSRNSIG